MDEFASLYDWNDFVGIVLGQLGIDAPPLTRSYEDLFRRMVVSRAAQALVDYNVIQPEDIEQASNGSTGILDLTGTGTSAAIAFRLEKLALGNNKSARVDRLEMNLSTFSIEADFTLIHKHSWE